MPGEAWQGRLRRFRANGIRGVDFKFTMVEVRVVWGGGDGGGEGRDGRRMGAMGVGKGLGAGL